MTTLMDLTADELADALTVMRHHPHNTGGLSQLDEATMGYATVSPELADAHRAFAAARHRHKDSYRRHGAFSDEAWAEAMDAAGRLADELHRLENFILPRCKREDRFGTCNMPLPADGVCRSSLHGQD